MTTKLDRYFRPIEEDGDENPAECGPFVMPTSTCFGWGLQERIQLADTMTFGDEFAYAPRGVPVDTMMLGDALGVADGPRESRVGYARIGYSEIMHGNAEPMLNDRLSMNAALVIEADVAESDTLALGDTLATAQGAPESRVGYATVGYAEIV